MLPKLPSFRDITDPLCCSGSVPALPQVPEGPWCAGMLSEPESWFPGLEFQSCTSGMMLTDSCSTGAWASKQNCAVMDSESYPKIQMSHSCLGGCGLRELALEATPLCGCGRIFSPSPGGREAKSFPAALQHLSATLLLLKRVRKGFL